MNFLLQCKPHPITPSYVYFWKCMFLKNYIRQFEGCIKSWRNHWWISLPGSEVTPVPLYKRTITNLIILKSNLYEEGDHIYISKVINLHRTESKPQALTNNSMNSDRFLGLTLCDKKGKKKNKWKVNSMFYDCFINEYIT